MRSAIQAGGLANIRCISFSALFERRGGLACAPAARRDLLHHMNSGRTDSTMTDRDLWGSRTQHKVLTSGDR
jgi:hypothetical protein